MTRLLHLAVWLASGVASVAQECTHSAVEPLSSEVAAPKPRTLFPVYGPQSQIGFIDASGRVVTPPRFVRIAGEFAEGLMAVAEPDRERYIDERGDARLNAPGSLAGPFSEGLAAVRVNNRFGYIDKTGRMVIPPAYQVAGEFHAGLAPVRTGGRHGYIDRTGQMVIPATYRWAGEFSDSDGLAAVDECSRCAYIDRSGKPAFEQRFYRCYRFAGGVAKVEITQGRWGFVTKSGRILGDPTGSKWAGGFLSEGLLAVSSAEGGVGFMDPAGKWVIEPKFAGVGPFSEGLAAVNVDGAWGYIDKSGGMVIAPAFGDPEDPLAGAFHNGLAFAADRKTGRYGFIDRTGKWVIAPRFQRCQEQYGYHCGFHGALARVETTAQILYINKSGKTIWSRSSGAPARR